MSCALIQYLTVIYSDDLPDGWQQFIHPEGQCYFVREDPRKSNIVRTTDGYVTIPAQSPLSTSVSLPVSTSLTLAAGRE